MRMAGQMRPPFSFWSCPKRECAAPGGREKGAKRAPVQWPSARDGGRRIGACSDFAWSSGTLCSSAIPVAADPWRMVRRASGCKNAFDQLLFPRVPLRYALPGARRSCCVGPCCSFHQPPASGSENRRRVYPCTSPGWRFPQGPDVSVPDCRKGSPAIPRRRQEVCACADRPAEHFFFSTGRGAFSF